MEPKKRRFFGEPGDDEQENLSENDDEDMDNSDNSEPEIGQEVMVDFEAQVPVDSDFYGIKQFLQQLFYKFQLDVGQLTEIILKQNYVGSVLKQAEDIEDSDYEENNSDLSFGLISVINITDKKEIECIKQLNDLLLEQCSKYSCNKNKELLLSLLSDNSKHIGFLVNERISSIPAKVSVPMLKCLMKEIEDAKIKKMAFDFEYFLIISKTYKFLSKDPNASSDNLFFVNAEEEYFQEQSILKFDYPVPSDAGTVGENEDSNDEETSTRTVMILPAYKLNDLVEKLKEAVA